jgi:hypothetical protein
MSFIMTCDNLIDIYRFANQNTAYINAISAQSL